MNKARQPMFNKLRKSLSKAVRNARKTVLNATSLRESDILTSRELNKRFPKKVSRKQLARAQALQRKKATRIRANKGKSGIGTSKRTSPSAITTRSAPAYPHKEGLRWIKSSSKKIKNQRVIASHHGGSKK